MICIRQRLFLANYPISLSGVPSPLEMYAVIDLRGAFYL